MVVQAVQFGKRGEPALHTQDHDSASVSIGAVTRGELLWSRGNSGTPAKPVTGTKHPGRRGHVAPLVKQSSTYTVQV